MAVSNWVALCAIAGASLASSVASAAPSASKARTLAPQEEPPAAPPPSQPAQPQPAQPQPAQPQPAQPQPAQPGGEPQPVQPGGEPQPATENGNEGTGLEGLAVSAPTAVDEASTAAGKLTVRPYLLVSGGMKADFVESKPGEEKNDRFSTFALGRLGLKARWLDLVYAESEFMASGGVGLHGTSAYEGQAAMQVRQQLVRISKYGWRAEVGRIIDEASVDYYSAHVADTFLQDTAVRDPLLFSGFNIGNGIRGTVQIVEGLRLGLTVNAGNPVSTTGSLMVGGAYPPFERFYTQPYQQVNQSANHFPDDTFHTTMVTPSVLVDTKYFDARVAVQGFDINANTTSTKDDHIRGYNLRATARVKLFDGLIVPFASSAYTRNDTLVPTDLSRRADERYQAVNLGAGVDLDLMRRYRCSYDCADGIGAQYQQVQYQIGDGLVTTQRFLNVGATYWLAPNLSLGARFAMWRQEAEQPVTAEGVARGQTRPGILGNGERTGIVSLRFIMP
jgi:hypothetical protein